MMQKVQKNKVARFYVKSGEFISFVRQIDHSKYEVSFTGEIKHLTSGATLRRPWRTPERYEVIEISSHY